ncbi:MAG: cation transporter [Deinococcales bacterium]
MITLKVEGMSCGHCKKAVEEALKSVQGAEKVEVNLAEASARVEGKASAEALIAAIIEEGYKASLALAS